MTKRGDVGGRSAGLGRTRLSADPATAGIRRVRASPCFSGYLLKCHLLRHLHLFRGESEGGWNSPIYLRAPPPFQRLALWESPDTARGAPWATLQRLGSLRKHIQRENLRNGCFWGLQPVRKGSRCSGSLIFSFSKDLPLDPICDQFGSPKGVPVLYDAHPGAGGTHGSIWALVGAQVFRLSATSGGSCAKSGYSWPWTCTKSCANQILQHLVV